MKPIEDADDNFCFRADEQAPQGLPVRNAGQAR